MLMPDPSLPPAYSQLLRELNGWEGFVDASYVVLFDAQTARGATEAYELPLYRPGVFAPGSDGGGEIIVCAAAAMSDT